MFDQAALVILQVLTVVGVLGIVLGIPLADTLLRKK